MFRKNGVVKFFSVINGTLYASSMVGAQNSSAVNVRENVKEIVVNYLKKAIKNFGPLAAIAGKIDGKEGVDYFWKKILGEGLLYAAEEAESLDELIFILRFSKNVFELKEQGVDINNQKGLVSSFFSNPFYLKSFSSYVFSKVFGSSKEVSFSIEDYKLALFEFFGKLKEKNKEDFKQNNVEDASELFNFCMSKVIDHKNFSLERLEDLFFASYSSSEVVKPVLYNMLSNLAKGFRNTYNSAVRSNDVDWSDGKKNYFLVISSFDQIFKEVAGPFSLIRGANGKPGYVNVEELSEYLDKKCKSLREVIVLVQELARKQGFQKEENDDQIEKKEDKNLFLNIDNRNLILNYEVVKGQVERKSLLRSGDDKDKDDMDLIHNYEGEGQVKEKDSLRDIEGGGIKGKENLMDGQIKLKVLSRSIGGMGVGDNINLIQNHEEDEDEKVVCGKNSRSEINLKDDKAKEESEFYFHKFKANANKKYNASSGNDFASASEDL